MQCASIWCVLVTLICLVPHPFFLSSTTLVIISLMYLDTLVLVSSVPSFSIWAISLSSFGVEPSLFVVFSSASRADPAI